MRKSKRLLWHSNNNTGCCVEIEHFCGDSQHYGLLNCLSLSLQSFLCQHRTGHYSPPITNIKVKHKTTFGFIFFLVDNLTLLKQCFGRINICCKVKVLNQAHNIYLTWHYKERECTESYVVCCHVQLTSYNGL